MGSGLGKARRAAFQQIAEFPRPVVSPRFCWGGDTGRDLLPVKFPSACASGEIIQRVQDRLG